MKLNPAQLGKHLQAGLAPVYVVSGDEPLLCQEAEDAIRAATRQQGFSERTVFHAEASFDWGLLYEAGASLSLFAEKRLIELRIANGKPGDKGTAAILEYLERPPTRSTGCRPSCCARARQSARFPGAAGIAMLRHRRFGPIC